MSNLATKLSNYSFENYEIRTILRNGELWFIAKDICDAVKISNVTDALIKLDKDEKATIGLTDSHGGMGAQRISIVSESGMYTLILRCRDAVKKDTAPYRFRKWVTSKVLPTIRKTGSYSLTINIEQQQAIKQAVNQRVFRTGEHYQAIYTKLYEQFKIPRYQDLPAIKFDEAIKFLGGILFTQNVNITESNLNCLISHSLWIYNFWQENRLYRAFTLLGSNFGAEMHNHIGSCYTLSLGLKRELDNSKRLTV